jgi:glycosyltransferase involved in cell wall biosynthesis
VAEGIGLSVVVPVLNEAENVGQLHGEIVAAAEQFGRPFEVLYIDDGSTDSTFEQLRSIQASDCRVKVLRLSRNYGQAAALTAGFDTARGDVVVPIDGDLQNDPADIPRLVATLDEGFDVVSGWRRKRRDKAISRRLPSSIANALIRWVTGVPLHDVGCTLKAYRRAILRDVALYGEMHRFIPAILTGRGARVTEMEVNHRPRTRGKTKYGLGRTFRVLLDLLTVKFLLRYITRPLHFFGVAGLLSWLAALGTGGAVIWMKLAQGWDMTGNPLLLLTVLLILMGGQFVGMGIFAELLVRVYHEPWGRRIYTVGETLGDDSDRS